MSLSRKTKNDLSVSETIRSSGFVSSGLSFMKIPTELHLEVSEYLSSSDIVSLSRVCNALRKSHLKRSFRYIYLISTELQPSEKLQIDPRYRIVPFKVLLSPEKFVGYSSQLVTHAILDAVPSTQFELLKDLATLFHPSIYPSLKTLDMTLKSVVHIAMGNPFTNAIFVDHQNSHNSSDKLMPPPVDDFSLIIGVMGFFYLSELKHSFGASIKHLSITDELKSRDADLYLFLNGVLFSEVFPNLVTFNFEPFDIFSYSIYLQVMQEVCKLPKLQHFTIKYFWNDEQQSFQTAKLAPKTLKTFKIILSHQNHFIRRREVQELPDDIIDLSGVTHIRIENLDYNCWDSLEDLLEQAKFGVNLRHIIINGRNRVHNALKLLSELIGDTTEIEFIGIDDVGCFHETIPGTYGELGILSDAFIPDSYLDLSPPMDTSTMFSNIKTLSLNVPLCFNTWRMNDYTENWRFNKFKIAKEINESISTLMRYIISNSDILEEFISQSKWRDLPHNEEDDESEKYFDKKFSKKMYKQAKKGQKIGSKNSSVSNIFDSNSKELTFFLFFMSTLPFDSDFYLMIEDIFENPTRLFGLKKKILTSYQDHMLQNRIDIYKGYYYVENILDAILNRTGMIKNLENLTIFGAIDLLSSPRFYKMVTDNTNKLKQVAFSEGVTLGEENFDYMINPNDHESNETPLNTTNLIHGLELSGMADIYKDYLKQVSMPKKDMHNMCKMSSVQVLDVEAMRKKYVLCKYQFSSKTEISSSSSTNLERKGSIIKKTKSKQQHECEVDDRKRLDYYDFLTISDIDPVPFDVLCPNFVNSHERYYWS